ncbi:MAG: hypothetical protein AUG51_07975 [Acidobacteria bacterium 13_1_20CM_3_53_8]|nr:MAG: hypothetical protein AUG51_07975 [Acidobacteria bacterium 13_1_20CM_3_53_8]
MNRELSANTTLSHYRIISKIGEGGMGEVYLAQDTQLDRPVALKFLPPDVAENQKRMQRFIQEAKAASALNHPNILTVYEIGQEDGTHFFATEFVDGVTLRQRMKGAPMKLSEVLEIATQVASALVAAHAAGIVHRDIKPENVMIRRDSYIKVLDFGLAKLTEKQTSSVDSEAATRALVNTDPGSVMGTVSYMSPEQAVGREVDARSDIWSLGVVIYEMVTGHLPFEGTSPSHVIVAITDKEPPPLAHYTPDIPEALELIVAEALTKDREERTQTAKEMLAKLRRLKQRIESGSDLERSVAPHSSLTTDAISTSSKSAEQQTVGPSARTTARSGEIGTVPTVSSAEFVAGKIKSHKTAVAVALVLGIVVLAGVVFGIYKFFGSNKQPSSKTMKITRLTTGGMIGSARIDGEATISPDGKYVVFATNEAGKTSIWLRQVSSNSLVQIVQPAEGFCRGNAFTPDGESIYYTFGDKNNPTGALYQVPVLGGTSRKILSNINSVVAFSPDGKRIAFLRYNQTTNESSLILANADGSNEQQIATRKRPDYITGSGMSWSPDGKLIACGVGSSTGDINSTVMAFSVEGGAPKPLTTQKWGRVYHVIWLSDGSGLIMTATADVTTPNTQLWFVSYPQGEARRITNDLSGYGGVSLGLTADNSTIVTVQEDTSSQLFITVAGEDASRARQISHGKYDGRFGLYYASDGRIIYFAQSGDNVDLFSVNADGSGSKQLTNDAFQENWPSVTPDGHYIVFTSNRSGNWNIWRIDSDGSNPKQLTEGAARDDSPSLSPDGRWVIFNSQRSGKNAVWKVSIDGGAPVELNDVNCYVAVVSPDGKFIAYLYTEKQGGEHPAIGLMPFDGGNPVKTFDMPLTLSDWAGLWWTPDGRAISYVDNANGVSNVWNQPVDGSPPKQVTKFTSNIIFNFFWSHDGHQLAVSRGTTTDDVVLIRDFR